jgi:hypothetical protein
MSLKPSMVEMGIGAAGVENEANFLRNISSDAQWMSKYLSWKIGKRSARESIAAAARSVGIPSNEKNAYNELNNAAQKIKRNGKKYSIPKICKEMSASFFEELQRTAARGLGKQISETIPESVVYGRQRPAPGTYRPNNRRTTAKATPAGRPSGISGFAMPDMVGFFGKKKLTMIDTAIIQSKIEAYSTEMNELNKQFINLESRCKSIKNNNASKNLYECSIISLNQIAQLIRDINLKKTALQELIRSSEAGAGSAGGKRKTRRNLKSRA